METPGAPNGLLVFAAGLVFLGIFIGLVWGLPALVDHVKRRRATPAGALTPARQMFRDSGLVGSGELVDVPIPASLLTMSQWLDRVNNHPDKVPHLAATGSTGSGKTTLITAVLVTRPGKVLICTPKPDDTWGGVPFITIDDDLTFRSIQQAAKAIDKEIKRRWVTVKQAKRTNKTYIPEWLTIVIDDYPFLQKKIAGLSDTVLSVARMGRSMRVRLILLAQESSVKALGFEGEGEARENFVFMTLPEAHWIHGGAKIYRWSKPKEEIDTRFVLTIASRAIPEDRWFHLPSVCLSEDSGSNFSHRNATDENTDRQTEAQTVQTDEQTGANLPPEEKEAIAVALIRDGKNRDYVRSVFRHMRIGLDNNEYATYRTKALTPKTQAPDIINN